ncbi:helix-turn-helix transcriptional regulator [Spirillospora sp. NPDC052269]
MGHAEDRVRIHFGKELHRMRTRAGYTQEQLAELLGCTGGWISTMESGRKISEQSANDLDTFFKTDGHFFRIWELSQEIEITTALPPGFPEYLSKERIATCVQIYTLSLISGLFQTEEYARAIMGSCHPEGDLEKLVATRMERQKILTKDDPPHIWYTLDEHALRNAIGGREIQRAQLEHLLALSELPNVSIRVVRQASAYHEGYAGPFIVLGMESGRHVAYTESAGLGILIEEPMRAAHYLIRYGLVSDHALTVVESRAFIRALLEEL